ncbi:MAG: 50S ribosomal protein L15 [Hadesarchaea archaeon DG-33-1]|nr:MAG: 50S ribosomal protein L15 [Hadesarchaea archaeon DG-33-1]
MARRRRKVRKRRGSRTMGRGSAKRGRGAGEKGGKGLSGGHKQKWPYTLKYMPKHFGKHGFVRPPEVSREVSSINVGKLDERLDELIQQGIARQEEDKFVLDVKKLGFDKVLGGGRVTHPLEVNAGKFSEQAKRKLEKAGGKAVEG